MKRALFLILTVVILTMTVVCGAPSVFAAPAPDYPTRQVTMICPYDPGGGTDTIMRVMAALLAEELGQPFVVENIPGAGTMLAANVLQQRPADGYTIGGLAAAATPWILSVMSETTPAWKPEDFTMVARATSNPSALGILVDKKKWQSFPDFIKDVKNAPPKTYNMGLQGPGAQYDPMLVDFQKVLGVEFNVIYYAGSSNLQTDIITGDLDACLTSCNVRNFIDNENFRVLALFGDSVPDDFPIKGLPFLAAYGDELGFDWSKDHGYMSLISGGQYYMVKTGTDQRIIDRLEEAIRKICTDPKTRQQILDLSYYPDFLDQTDVLKVMESGRNAMLYYKETAAKQ
ncbi:hypothetical protein FACS1894187_09490 [Synergistales bacterium]|nr:hypothetical protein FACS1894187_09490 [Synergistales bacterium]